MQWQVLAKHLNLERGGDGLQQQARPKIVSLAGSGQSNAIVGDLIVRCVIMKPICQSILMLRRHTMLGHWKGLHWL